MAQAKAQTESGSLMDFSFDNDQSFFGIKDEQSQVEAVVKEIKATGGDTEDGSTDLNDDKKTGISAVATPDDDEPEEEVFFADPKEETTKPEKVDAEKTPKESVQASEENPEVKAQAGEDTQTGADDKFFTTLAQELKGKGVFQNVEIKEGEEITEEKFFELQDEEIEARVQETFDAFFNEMDEDGKAFLRFKKEGGQTHVFLANYGSSLPLDNIDIEDEKQMKQVLVHYLSTVEKLDHEEIQDRLDYLKESGKEKTYSAKYLKSLKDEEKQRKETIVKGQETAARARESAVKEFNESLNETLKETEEVGAFKFTKVEQKEIGSYVTKPTVKVGANKYIPAFQADLAKIFKAETKEDKQKLLLIAKLIKTNFDVKDLVTETKTKVVKEAKSKLQEVKNGSVKASSSGGATKKSLSDYFN